MSGGSFNYLCDRCPEDALADYERDLGRMILYVNELGLPEADAGAIAGVLKRHLIETRDRLEQAGHRHRQLYELMKAIEWRVSGDWTSEQVQRTYKRFLRDLLDQR